MKKVFSSNEISEIVLIRDALERKGIEVTIQNEFSGRGAVPEFRPPAEIWVWQDEHYDRARRVVTQTLATLDCKTETAPWVCTGCSEENPQSFDVCWSCGREKNRDGAKPE
jgi:hypothetical protein